MNSRDRAAAELQLAQAAEHASRQAPPWSDPRWWFDDGIWRHPDFPQQQYQQQQMPLVPIVNQPMQAP